jgi:hypothetical protein
VRARLVEEIKAFVTGTLGLAWLGCIQSPLLVPEGNVEFLVWWRKGSRGPIHQQESMSATNTKVIHDGRKGQNTDHPGAGRVGAGDEGTVAADSASGGRR